MYSVINSETISFIWFRVAYLYWCVRRGRPTPLRATTEDTMEVSDWINLAGVAIAGGTCTIAGVQLWLTARRRRRNS